MGMPKVLDWLDDLVKKVATNTTDIQANAKNIETNKQNIAANKTAIDQHKADDTRHWTTEDRQNFDRTIHFKGYFTTIDKLKEAYPKGELGDYAIVGGTDTVWLWDDTTSSWLNSTEQGIVISVNGKTGELVLTKTDVGLSEVDNTSDKDKPISTAQQKALDEKVNKAGDTMTGALNAQNINPTTTNTYSLGTSALKWKNVYATTFVGALTGNADTATKLKTGKTIQTDLGSTEAKSFDGSANITPRSYWNIASF